MEQQKIIILFGAILAGGKATRMHGTAKGNLLLADGGTTTIISHQLREFNKVGINNIVISANFDIPYLQYETPLIHDQRINFGPLSGIISVLHYFQSIGHTDFSVCFLPCDLPNITANELMQLKNFYINKQINAPIVFASSADGAHPLCALVNVKVLPQLCNLVFEENIKKVMQVWRELGAVPLMFENNAPFLNVNTSADYADYYNKL